MKLQNVVIEAASPVKKVIGLYPGRFQPFGQHHAKAYEWMGKQFGTYRDKDRLPMWLPVTFRMITKVPSRS